MERQKVESSLIASLGYDAGARKLEVEFKGYGKPGSVYEYENVELETYNGFFATEKDAEGKDQPVSIGKYFGSKIKADPKKYPYKKLSK